MIRLIIVIAAIFISSCVSYSEMQKKEPALEIDSSKSPSVYASCIAPKFMEIWPGMVSVIPDGVNTVVAVAGESGGFMVATATISATDTGSHISLREMAHINLGDNYQRARAAIESCS